MVIPKNLASLSMTSIPVLHGVFYVFSYIQTNKEFNGTKLVKLSIKYNIINDMEFYACQYGIYTFLPAESSTSFVGDVQDSLVS